MVSKSRGPATVPKENVTIQAVLVADSFDENFTVFTIDRPKALIPFLNKPLIDYSLGLLKYNGVQEVFVFCSQHQKQIRDHIKEVWPNTCQMTVHVFSSDSYMSPGDVFRDLDAKALVKGDFILIHGDVVGNLPLLSFLDEHKSRRATDKGCVMTSVYRKVSPDHKNRDGVNEPVIVTDLSGKILSYETGFGSRKRIKIPLESFRENQTIRIQRDIQETHISICSVNMLMSFSENVDHQSKDDFIRGTLVDQEIHGTSIHVSIASEGYGGRVTTPRQYHVMSQDLICRWNHPVVPENFLGCCRRRHNVYIDKRNKGDLVRCSLEKNVLIGSSTSLGSNVTVKNSVIGSNCKIGNNVSLDGVYIWDDVQIGDNCVLSSTILSNGVRIKSGVTLRKGCLISSHVILGPDVTLEKVTLKNCGESESDRNLVGSEGRGVVHESECEEKQPVRNLVGSEGRGVVHESECEKEKQPVSWEPDEEEVEEEVSEDESDSEASDFEPQNEDEDVKVFFNELIDNFKRGVRETISCDNLVLEVNSVKHAFNIPIDEVNVLVIQALLHLPEQLKGRFEGDFFSQLKSVFTIFLNLVKNYIKSHDSQLMCLQALEEYCLNRKELFTTGRLCKLIMMLYEEDVLEDDAIIDWYSNLKPLPQLMVFGDESLDPDVQVQVQLRKEDVLVRFIKWLEEAEEESDSE